MSGDVTDAGRTDDKRRREDSATEPMDAGWLSFAILFSNALGRRKIRLQNNSMSKCS